jgi:hypothetical protein
LVHSSSSDIFFKIASKLFKGSREKVNFVFGTPICFACLIESYWKVIQAILKYYWRVLNVILKISPVNIISPIYFNLTVGKMIITTAHQRTILKVKNQ